MCANDLKNLMRLSDLLYFEVWVAFGTGFGFVKVVRRINC